MSPCARAWPSHMHAQLWPPASLTSERAEHAPLPDLCHSVSLTAVPSRTQMIFATQHRTGKHRHFRRMHDKKVNALALAAVVGAPDAMLPAEVAAGLPQLMAGLLRLLVALKQQQARIWPGQHPIVECAVATSAHGRPAAPAGRADAASGACGPDHGTPATSGSSLQVKAGPRHRATAGENCERALC